MIVELSVENLAIIEQANFKPNRGFTVLTGETGAGKSLLMDAIELALGGRADTELVRTGANKATVEARFKVLPASEASIYCERHGIEIKEGQLHVKREVSAEGRSSVKLNGVSVPISKLRELGGLLVDLHGQHDHQSLLDQSRHLGFFDAYIGLEAKEILFHTHNAHSTALGLRTRFESLKKGMRDREQRLDSLLFQIEDIEAVYPVVGEYEDIEGKQNRLKNLERLQLTSQAAVDALSDGEFNAVDLLLLSEKSARDGSKFDSDLSPVAERLTGVIAEVNEAIYELRQYVSALEADPTQLDELSERKELLKRLRKKYGANEAEILVHLSSVKAEYELLSGGTQNLEELEEAVKRAEEHLDQRCSELTALRVRFAPRFEKEVESHLNELALPNAVFRVRIERCIPTEFGADALEYDFSANLGEAPKPLGRVASGGEASRVMLAIKVALAGRGGVPTLIFDEIDSGLSGRAAASVAKKMIELARHYQVLAISHLPQIASAASQQYQIEKSEVNGRVRTSVVALNDEERVEEIARMLAGNEVTPAAKQNARDMLNLSQAASESLFI